MQLSRIDMSSGVRLTLASTILFVLGCLNYRSWRGYSTDRHVEIRGRTNPDRRKSPAPIRVRESVRRASNRLDSSRRPRFPVLGVSVAETFRRGRGGMVGNSNSARSRAEFAVLSPPWAASSIVLSPWPVCSRPSLAWRISRSANRNGRHTSWGSSVSCY